jgi:glycosyltransferase involved in cell wall biosynthesis/SAM-dependent methyltransferase
MRIILATDPPWLFNANSKQMAELARRLMDDLHTVYWMPTRGFEEGGTLSWEGIEILPGDNSFGNEIINHHVVVTGAHLVITRGDANQFPSYGGSDFAWFAWNPKNTTRKILRKANKAIVSTRADGKLLEKYGVLPVIIPPGVSEVFTSNIRPELVDRFRQFHAIPKDAFLVSALGAQDPHWKRMLEAFKIFRDKHHDAIIYMHTDPTIPLQLLDYADEIGLPEDSIRFPDGYNFHRGFPDEMIAAMYKASRIHIVPGKAIVPLLESLAVGTPVLTTKRPEIEQIIQVEGLGAVVPPITWHEKNPLLHIPQYAEEMENAYQMSVEAQTNHSRICQMIVRDYHWRKVYEEKWRPLLAEFEAEEQARKSRISLQGVPADSSKRDSKQLEDRGWSEEHQCDVVRKYDIGGSSQDERQQNAIVKSWGPHPNIIPILEEGEDEFHRYYFDTPRLAPCHECGPFTKKQADKILGDIRAALSFMHERGAAHCDVNPRNVLLTDTKKDGDKWVIGPKMKALLFDFDFMQSGLTPEEAYLCDYEPLDERVLKYAVPIMKAGIATRGFHRLVTFVRNLPFHANTSTSKPDVPYQKIDGVGERDCDERWTWLKPDVKGKRVIDLGTNLGYFAARAMQEGAESVIGIDRDKAILESARRLHPELDGNLIQLDLNEKMPEGEFDVCFCLSLWQHLKAGKRPLLRYLKAIPITYWEDANLTKPELERMGFDVTRIGATERGRNLFLLKPKVEANA